MSEYEAMAEPGVYGAESEKSGSILKGTAAGIILTVILELGVGLALQADTNLVHRYIAYLLGLLPIFLAAIISRSTTKMVFIGAPVIIISSFVLPYVLPDIFTGLMTPFLTLLPIINEILSTLGEMGTVNDSELATFNAFQQYAIVIDFVFGFIVGMLAAIGLTGVVKLVTQKPGILSLVTGLIAIIFFVLGVVILPYLLVVTSGVAQFGLTFSAGGITLNQGLTEATAENGSLELANQYFGDAEAYFADAEQVLEGLKALGVFDLIVQFGPQYEVIVENGLVLLSAAVDLAQGISPALSGVGALQKGMEQSLDALNAEAGVTLSQGETEQFNEGLELVEQGFANFSDASDKIKEALAEFENLNEEELTNALNSQGVEGVAEQLALVKGGTTLLNYTLDVFTNDEDTGLINDPDGDGPRRAPIIHLLQGAWAMNKAQEIIGDTTSFQGTAPAFRNVIGNLTFLLNSLDPSFNPAIDQLETADIGDSEVILDFRTQVLGTINFLKDSGNTTIGIGEFGVIASPTLNSMNQSLSVLTGADDFTTVTSEQYEEQIDVFDGNATITRGIVTNATRMRAKALAIESNIAVMEVNVAGDSYGFLAEPANDFVTEFKSFDLTQNADNFFYISSAFSALLKSMNVLTGVDHTIDQIRNNVTIIKTELAEAEVDVLDFDVNAVNNSVNFIKADIIEANSSIGTSKYHITHSADNFTLVVNMPQLSNTADSFDSISIHMDNMQFGNETVGIDGINGIQEEMDILEQAIENIELILSDGYQSSTDDPLLEGNFTIMEDSVGRMEIELDFIQSEFQGVQADLANVNIES